GARPIAPRKAGPEWASRLAPGVPRGSMAAQDERAPRKPRRGRSADARFVTKRSAGLLMYRARGSALEVLLVHPGGPFFRNKDAGVWTIPKGEPEPGEDLLAVAVREFREETGFEPTGPYLELTPVK